MAMKPKNKRRTGIIGIVLLLLACMGTWLFFAAWQRPASQPTNDLIAQISELADPDVLNLALYMTVLPIVLVASISEALGQFYVLLANRVRPVRLVLTLSINVLIFVLGFFFTVFTVWVVGRFVFGYEGATYAVIPAVGVSYVPLTLGFLSAIPHFGVGIVYTLYLAVYALLAQNLVAFGFTPVDALVCCGLSLIVNYTMRATVGRPITWAIGRIRDLAAGTRLSSSINKALIQFDAQYMHEMDEA